MLNHLNRFDQLTFSLLIFIFLSCNSYVHLMALSEDSSVSNGIELRAPTKLLMTQGGDERLVLHAQTGVNKYYTMPSPRLDVIARASCTSSFPSQRAFQVTQEVQKNLLHEERAGRLDQSFEQQMNDVRLDILKILHVAERDAYAILTPSGSDAELFFTLLGLLRHEKWREHGLNYDRQMNSPCVLNIIAAAGEVGSGTASAAGGRYFSSILPQGKRAIVGAMVRGFPERAVEVLEMRLRNKQTGKLESLVAIEEKLEQILFRAIEEKKQIVVLHQVHASKTGFGMPRIDFVKAMKKKYGDKLIVVVDLAQMRGSDGLIAQYLKHDFCLLVTGSKFFAGPPFSGVVLFPVQEAQAFQLFDLKKLVPEGFGDYFSRYDIDYRLSKLVQLLPAWKNYGLLLRWHAALVNMRDFYCHQASLRSEIARQWVTAVRKKIQVLPQLQMFDDIDNAQDIEMQSTFGDVNTIVSCGIFAFNESSKTIKMLPVTDLKFVYQLLVEDIASRLPKTASQEEIVIAQKSCLVGQPVELALGKNNLGVLRIALDAPLISKIASKCGGLLTAVEGALQEELAHDEILLKKMSLIGKYYNFLRKKAVQ